MLPRLITFYLILLITIFGIYLAFIRSHVDPNQVRYIALGDSYTYGQGATPGEDDWPTLLTQDLRNHEMNIIMVQNLGHDNWTSQQVIDMQLPIYKQLHPTFATLLVGANDWVQNIPAELFRQRFAYLLDQMLAELPNKSRLLVLTIPSYDTTPYGIGLGLARKDSVTVKDYNHIIQQEAQKRGLTLIDLYPTTQAMAKDPTLISKDQLHPSAKEYKLWEQLIYPVAYATLKQ